MDYPIIPGTELIPQPGPQYDVTSDALASIPALASPPFPKKGGKHIFAFWHSGIATLPPYLKRNVLSWYKRFAPLGWNIYVLDGVAGSPLHFSRYIDATSPSVVPQALIDGTLGGGYASQHTSDLVRYPLLINYGGVYLDVGILQFGDLNWLWEEHLANPDSPYEFAGYTMGEPPEHISIVNFALMSVADCPLVLRAHKILIKLWEGKTSTVGAHSHPLVSHVPLMRVPPSVSEGKGSMDINDESMTDYAIQIQAMGSAQRWLDEADGWDGPEYVRDKCWLYSMLEMAYVNENLTDWDSKRQFELFALKMPRSGEEETADQKLAREIVEKSIAQSWCLKLAHGFSAKLFGAPTLGMHWRANDGSDCGPGTYGGWLRWVMSNLVQKNPPAPLRIPVYKPTMVGSLMIESNT